MSWCRWGSRCDGTIPQYVIDVECVAKGCPGSDLYIWEGSSDRFFCGCDFSCDTEEEMRRHVVEHDSKGHHVRRSLLHWAKTGKMPELTPEWASLVSRT